MIFSAKRFRLSKTVRILLSACVILSYFASWHYLSNLATKVLLVNGWIINASAEDINEVYLYGILSLIAALITAVIFLKQKEVKTDHEEPVQKI